MNLTLIDVDENGKGQVAIDGVLKFIKGKYLCGTPYKHKVFSNRERIKTLQAIADSIDEFPFPVKNFEYNGFMGKIGKGMADYTCKFKEWTCNPGVAVMDCSDGEERLIPTFAIRGSQLLSAQVMEPKEKVLFGPPCSS